jgi:hypothetical protein
MLSRFRPLGTKCPDSEPGSTREPCRLGAGSVYDVLLAGTTAAQDLSKTRGMRQPSRHGKLPTRPPPNSSRMMNRPVRREPYPTGPFFDIGYSDWCWHIRPKGFIYSTYWASAAEPRLATHAVKNLGGQLACRTRILAGAWGSCVSDRRTGTRAGNWTCWPEPNCGKTGTKDWMLRPPITATTS